MKFRYALLAAITFALVMANMPSASAMLEPPTSSSHIRVITPAKANWYQYEMNLIAPYIHKTSYGGWLDSTGAIRRGVSGTVVNEVKAGLATLSRKRATAGMTPDMLEPPHCYGSNGVTRYWYGLIVFSLNECITEDIIFGMQQGMSVGALAAAALVTEAAPVALVIGLVVTTMAIEANGLNHCARDGNGVKVYQEVVLPDFWCTTQ